MKADFEWVEKVADGVKRKTRVTFIGHHKIKWQFKRSDEEFWDYDTPPAPADWEMLEEKVAAHYNRRRTPYKNLELVRILKKAANV